jgi:N-acetylneuraminic acid mutarotase
VGGGLIAGDRSTAASYILDPRTGDTTALRALPVAVHDAAGSLVGGRPVIVGGGNQSEQSAVQELAPSGQWRVIGHLPTARSDLATVSVAGRLIVMGGYDGVSAPSAVLLSNDGRTFTTTARLPVAVRYAAVAVAPGAIWLLGGEHGGKPVDTVQRIDTRTWNVRVVGRLSRPITEATAAYVAGRILLIGGRTSAGSVTSRMWWWDVRRNSLRPAGRLPYPLADAGLLTTRSGAYLLGGERPQLSNRVLGITFR